MWFLACLENVDINTCEKFQVLMVISLSIIRIKQNKFC